MEEINKEFIKRIDEIDNLEIGASEKLVLHLISIFEFANPKPTYEDMKNIFLRTNESRII